MPQRIPGVENGKFREVGQKEERRERLRSLRSARGPMPKQEVWAADTPPRDGARPGCPACACAEDRVVAPALKILTPCIQKVSLKTARKYT